MRSRPLIPRLKHGAGAEPRCPELAVLASRFRSRAARSKVTGFAARCFRVAATGSVQRPDGVLELDLRITLETDDGALVHMTFEGIRDDGAPGAPYFRTLPRFETAEAKYSFLNRLLAVGTGKIGAGSGRST